MKLPKASLTHVLGWVIIYSVTGIASAQVQGPSGSGGQVCTRADYTYGRLISIESRSGLWMDAINLIYDMGKGKQGIVRCRGTGGSVNLPLDIGPDEYISAVSGRGAMSIF